MGGGTLILLDTCIYRLVAFFWGGGGGTGFKFLNYIIFWGVQKYLYFWGYEDFVDIFGGHDKIGLVLGVSSMYFKVFS